jgi:outer membrane protein assembly factor BamB
VRACADAQCTQPFPDTTHSIGYTLRVNAVGEWETLQRTSRHDGYVPIKVDPTRYRLAWSWQNPAGGDLSPVVTGGDLVYVAGSPSLFALRASNGAVQWRRVFNASRLNPPTISNGIVYAATTGHEETYLYALRASDGQQQYLSRFYTQWARILNPTVRGNRVFVNAGYYGGVVYAFDQNSGNSAWNTSGGTYGMNSPAVDDAYVYAFNGSTLDVMRASDGVLRTSIGPDPGGIQEDYNGTVMLGSADHALAYDGTGFNLASQRQLVDYSVASDAVRWRSVSLYTNFPAVAKGVVYATSNETRKLDALDEATGRVLWSWRPPEQYAEFIGNVVATENAVFVSTMNRLYAIDLRTRKTRWSAPTPGTVSISADRMLFVSSLWDYYGENARVTAYVAD